MPAELSKRRILVWGLLLACCAPTRGQDTYYVDVDAVGTDDGSTWIKQDSHHLWGGRSELLLGSGTLRMRTGGEGNSRGSGC